MRQPDETPVEDRWLYSYKERLNAYRQGFGLGMLAGGSFVVLGLFLIDLATR